MTGPLSPPQIATLRALNRRGWVSIRELPCRLVTLEALHRRQLIWWSRRDHRVLLHPVAQQLLNLPPEAPQP